MAVTTVFTAIGTQWTISVRHVLAPNIERELWHSIRERIKIFETVYSRFCKDSLVSAIAQKAGVYQFPADGAALFRTYRQAYDISGGRVTPLIGQLLVAAGYDDVYTLVPQKELTSPPAWDDVMTVQGSTITTTQPIQLDFGAGGKGYLVDCVADLLIEKGYTSFIINAGGDVRVASDDQEEMTPIALEHPTDPTRAIGVAHLREGSVCGSSTQRRRWAHFHHVIDPHTRLSPTTYEAVFSYAPTALVADLVTTIVMCAPEVLVKNIFTCTVATITPQGDLRADTDFPAEFFLAAPI